MSPTGDPARHPPEPTAADRPSDHGTDYRCVRVIKGHKALVFRGVNAVAFSPDGRVLASGGTDKTVRLWNPTTSELITDLTLGSPGNTLAFSPDGQLLATGGDFDNSIRLWER